MRDHKEEMKKNAANFLIYSYFGKVNDEFFSQRENIDDKVSFLIYTYFGEVKEKLDSENDIIEAAIARAYQDATLLGAYNTLLPKPKNENDKGTIELRLQSAKAYDEAFDLMKTNVKELLDHDKDFDDVHKKICVGSEDKNEKNLVDIYEKIIKEKTNGKKLQCFTPGNAQKWVNMTMKNLYVICGMMMACSCNRAIEDFCEVVFERAKFFHIPVDSYILKVWETLGSPYVKINKDGAAYINYKKVGDNNYTLSDSEGKGTLTTTWSKIENYQIYQELWNKYAKTILEEDEWPIEWESENWIKASVSRKYSSEEI